MLSGYFLPFLGQVLFVNNEKRALHEQIIEVFLQQNCNPVVFSTDCKVTVKKRM